MEIKVEVRDYVVFFHNYGHVDGDAYVIVLDRSTLGDPDRREFIICHEVFHYVQTAYVDFDPSLDIWLLEPTATAMAEICSGVRMPVPAAAFEGDVFANELIASFFWKFLVGTAPDVVRDFLDDSRGTLPTPTGFGHWLEMRRKESLDSLIARFRLVRG